MGYLNLASNASRSSASNPLEQAFDRGLLRHRERVDLDFTFMSAERRANPFWIFFAIALAIVTAATASAMMSSLPAWIGALGGVNLATILLYGYDKAVAGGRKTRVPEKVLHLLALLGGSPAALLGQRLFRHKTIKASFRTLFWLIVALQLMAAGALSWWWFSRRS
jgi:uncharacterized membrane protein YsdA (DUF1294 family)